MTAYHEKQEASHETGGSEQEELAAGGYSIEKAQCWTVGYKHAGIYKRHRIVLRVLAASRTLASLVVQPYHTGENVIIHEKLPDKALVPPARVESSGPEHKGATTTETIIRLTEESTFRRMPTCYTADRINHPWIDMVDWDYPPQPFLAQLSFFMTWTPESVSEISKQNPSLMGTDAVCFEHNIYQRYLVFADEMPLTSRWNLLVTYAASVSRLHPIFRESSLVHTAANLFEWSSSDFPRLRSATMPDMQACVISGAYAAISVIGTEPRGEFTIHNTRCLLKINQMNKLVRELKGALIYINLQTCTLVQFRIRTHGFQTTGTK